MDPEPLPRPMKVIVALFIIAGVSSASTLVHRSTSGPHWVDPGIMGLPIGIGLVYRSKLAYHLARASSFLCACLFGALFFIAPRFYVAIHWLGRTADGPGAWLFGAAVLAGLFAGSLWVFTAMGSVPAQRAFRLNVLE